MGGLGGLTRGKLLAAVKDLNITSPDQLHGLGKKKPKKQIKSKQHGQVHAVGLASKLRQVNMGQQSKDGTQVQPSRALEGLGQEQEASAH